jgi:hypothetical protein
MVIHTEAGRSSPSGGGRTLPRAAARRALTLACAAAFALTGCQTYDPIAVTPAFSTSAALAMRNPADVAVLPIEDGTADAAAGKHLTYLRQVLMRELPNRRYSPLRAEVVDAALGKEGRGQGSTLEPAYLQRVAGKSSEEALLAVRIDRWDESTLLTDKRLRFQFQAALIASDGQQLWHGTLSGETKAGGAGAAPRDREGMARSCGELALVELLKHLPQRNPGGQP